MALEFFARMQNQAVTTLARFLMRRFYIKNLPIVAEKRNNKNNRQTGYLFLDMILRTAWRDSWKFMPFQQLLACQKSSLKFRDGSCIASFNRDFFNRSAGSRTLGFWCQHSFIKCQMPDRIYRNNG